MYKIYVKLLDEGTDVWIPVDAEKINDHYKIISENTSDGDEIWEFNYGDHVKVKKRKFSGGFTGLVAVELFK